LFLAHRQRNEVWASPLPNSIQQLFRAMSRQKRTYVKGKTEGIGSTGFSEPLGTVVSRREVGEQVRRSVQCELDDASEDEDKQYSGDDQI
jgi:hypothetical protein